MPGTFVIRRGRTGTFRFVLLSANGNVIATSEVYDSKAACRNGIRTLQRVATDARVEDASAERRLGLKNAAAPAKDAAKKAKAAVARTAKKLPAPPPPVKDAAKKAKAAVARTAKKESPQAEKGPGPVQRTTAKTKGAPTDRTSGSDDRS